MQPTHCTSDMPGRRRGSGPSASKGAYAWRAFLDAGCRIASGTDFPVESARPAARAFTRRGRRQDKNGWPDGGFLPEQRMSPAEALRSFTLDAAYAAFLENELGSIEVGKRADLTVLDRDPVACADRDVLAAKVVMTVVGGRPVYAAPAGD